MAPKEGKISTQEWLKLRAAQIRGNSRPLTQDQWNGFAIGLDNAAAYIDHLEGLLAGAVQHSLMRDKMDELAVAPSDVKTVN